MPRSETRIGRVAIAYADIIDSDSIETGSLSDKETLLPS